MEKEYIEFKVYVANHILDEDDCYQVKFEFMMCEIAKDSTESTVQYFERHHDVLHRLHIEGEYETCYDLNGTQGFHKHMRLVKVLQDRTAQRMNGLPTQAGYYPCIQLVPEQQIWFKYVQLNEIQVAAAKKIIHEVEERPFKRVKSSTARLTESLTSLNDDNDTPTTINGSYLSYFKGLMNSNEMQVTNDSNK